MMKDEVVAEIFHEGVKLLVEVKSGGVIFVNGQPLSYEVGLERLRNLGLIFRVNGAGRRFCSRCRIAFPVDVWGNIFICPFCGGHLRTRPRCRGRAAR